MSDVGSEVLLLLKAYEQWEADIILENKCWTGQNIQLTDELYERMIVLQGRRNKAIAALAAVPAQLCYSYPPKKDCPND